MSAATAHSHAWRVHATLHQTDAGPTLVVSGRLGTTGAAGIRTTLESVLAQGRTVRLDLAEVDYISSAGIGVLRDAALAAHASGHALVLVAASEPVRVALKLAGAIPHLQTNLP